MQSTAMPRYLLVLSVLALFVEAAATAHSQSPTPGEESTLKQQAAKERTGCVCVKFMHADLGETQVYYAHEYDECIEELCPYPNIVYVTGTDLTINEQCPDCDYGQARQEARSASQPKLAAPKPENFDIHLPGDPDVKLNPDLPKKEKGCLTGKMTTDDGEEILVKVFFTRVRSLTVTAVACFGVEINHLTEEDFNVPAVKVSDFDHLYRIQLNSQCECLVITAE